MFGIIESAWRFRFFITSSIRTELRIKFVRSRLGGLWMILNPLAQVLIFAFILSAVLSAKLPGIDNRYAYAIYLMSGTLGWSLFSEIINRCLTLFRIVTLLQKPSGLTASLSGLSSKRLADRGNKLSAI